MKASPTPLNWTSLLVSNVLLALPVTFSFAVLGFLASDLAICLERDGNAWLLPECLRSEEGLRALCVSCATLAGFIIAQLCFAMRVLKEDSAPLWSLRFRLLTSLVLMLAAGGFLYLNVRTVVLQEQQGYLLVRCGWPFQYLRESTWTGSPPDTTWFYLNFGANFVFCGDLLLVIMVVCEFFFARRDAKAAARTAASSPPPSATTTTRNTEDSLPLFARAIVDGGEHVKKSDARQHQSVN